MTNNTELTQLEYGGNLELEASTAKIMSLAHAKGTKQLNLKCGAKLKDNRGLCRAPAGRGTTHVGMGPCEFHDNIGYGTENKNYRHGLYSKITIGNIGELALELQEDRDVFDMRQHIALLEAIALTALNKGAVGTAASALMQAIKAIKQLHEIEVGKKVLVNIEEVSKAMEQVVVIIQTHVRDRETVEAIARDLGKLSISRTPQLPARPNGSVDADD